MAKNKLKTITLEEWRSHGEKLFGKDMKQWIFKCPSCGNTQNYEDFKKTGMDDDRIRTVIHFSCIGRWNETQGCDYTSGGLFCINNVIVESQGEKVPVFEFSREIVKVKPTKFLKRRR